MTGESRGFFRVVVQSVGFLLSYDGELRELLVCPQVSPVSIRVVRGSAALLSTHGRGVGPQDALKGEPRGFSRVAAGNPGFPRLATVTSGSISGCLWEVRNTADVGGASRTPLGLVQAKRASSRVEAGTSGFLSSSDLGLRLCKPFQTVSQVSTCVDAWNLHSSRVFKGFSGLQLS